MTITGAGSSLEYRGDGNDAWQVTTFSSLRGLLTDGAITDFNNTLLPLVDADFTGGYQWTDVVIPTGETLEIGYSLGLNDSAPGGPVPPANVCLSVDGVPSFGFLDDPDNVILTTNIGAGNAVTGVAWDVEIVTVDPSWFSETTVLVSDSTGSADADGEAFTPGAGPRLLWSHDIQFRRGDTNRDAYCRWRGW